MASDDATRVTAAKVWCHRHDQAAKVGEQCKASGSAPSYKHDDFWDAADHMVGTTWEMTYPLEDCIRA